jgi:hypothetical protein
MNDNWAAEHLQIIRTLMERAALYRRALAPLMLMTGSVGALGALAGWKARIELPGSFITYWLVIGAVTCMAAFVLVRAQALKDSEAFWSPPTRRVALALLPPLMAGLLMTLGAGLACGAPRLAVSMTLYPVSLGTFIWLPATWIILYGCALHAAGFFMPRGMKLFGWSFILGGCALFWITFSRPPTFRTGHALMGAFFGALHLAYGVYLHFTEKKQATT